MLEDLIKPLDVLLLQIFIIVSCNSYGSNTFPGIVENWNGNTADAYAVFLHIQCVASLRYHLQLRQQFIVACNTELRVFNKFSIMLCFHGINLCIITKGSSHLFPLRKKCKENIFIPEYNEPVKKKK